MQELLLPCLFLIFTSVSSEFVLRPKDPPLNIEKLEASPEHPLVIRCVTGPGQKWLFNGGDLGSDHGVLISDGTDSVLNITSFNPKLHSGVYECYEGHLSASVRVESDVDPPIPSGFRPCEGEENNRCFKGSCGVDSYNSIACFCPPGWSGAKCDTPLDKVRLPPKETTCWIVIAAIVMSIIIVNGGLAALMIYRFCPFGACKRDEKKPERCDSLLEKGEDDNDRD